MPLYEPQEDSELLRRFVVEYAFGDVLDMGTGSGILAFAAAEKDNVKSVLAVDIDDESLEYVKNNKNKKISAIKSDLFANITTNDIFDTIIFNPPYLPQDPKDSHQALYGGAEGYELTVRFLDEAKTHLTSGGIILLLFSSLTNKERVDTEIKKRSYHFKELGFEAHFFERLYVYRLWRD